MTEGEPIPRAFINAFQNNDSSILVPEVKPYISEMPEIQKEEVLAMFSETSNVLDGYFGVADVGNFDSMSQFLFSQPITFLRDAQQGNFLLNGLRADQKTLNDKMPQKEITELGIIWGNAFSAYRLTKTIFRSMPFRAENYPTHLLTPPPYDAEGFANRVTEISEELEKIAEGKTPYKLNPRSSDRLWRAFSFIKTGADLRIN